MLAVVTMELMESEYDSASSEEDVNRVRSEGQMAFVRRLQNYKILFSKSQAPDVRRQKEQALNNLLIEHNGIFKMQANLKQLAKKLNNMKSHTRTKFHMHEAGKRRVKFKPWEKLLLDIINEKHFESLQKKSNESSGSEVIKQELVTEDPFQSFCPSSDLDQQQSETATLFLPPAPLGGTQELEIQAIPDLFMPNITLKTFESRTKLPETKETIELTTSELKRLVLLEQLKLIRMQQQEINRKRPSLG